MHNRGVIWGERAQADGRDLRTVEDLWPTSNSGQASAFAASGDDHGLRLPFPRLPLFDWLARVPSRGLTLSLSHHRRRAVGSWPAERRIWRLPCSALHPFLATIIGELTLCRAGPIFWEHLMSAQRTAGLHNASLQVSALLIARFLALVSAPSRGAR